VPSAESVPLTPGKAKIVLERTDVYLYSGVQARIDINGERVVELWGKEIYAGLFDPGKITISATSWGTSGKCTVVLNAEPDREYTFIVSAIKEHHRAATKGLMWPALLGGPIGVAIHQATYDVEENNGPFLIKPKE